MGHKCAQLEHAPRLHRLSLGRDDVNLAGVHKGRRRGQREVRRPEESVKVLIEREEDAAQRVVHGGGDGAVGLGHQRVAIDRNDLGTALRRRGAHPASDGHHHVLARLEVSLEQQVAAGILREGGVGGQATL